jgi:hypothetical protein
MKRDIFLSKVKQFFAQEMFDTGLSTSMYLKLETPERWQEY